LPGRHFKLTREASGGDGLGKGELPAFPSLMQRWPDGWATTRVSSLSPAPGNG
jgi:hypothetical protein